MVIRMRHTRAHTGNRRSHHALTAANPSLCKECGHPRLPHTACANCGTYKGKTVINVSLKTEKKAKNKAKKSEAAR
ncbi:MAG: 50S ribosomal protein L32 [bacterium]